MFCCQYTRLSLPPRCSARTPLQAGAGRDWIPHFPPSAISWGPLRSPGHREDLLWSARNVAQYNPSRTKLNLLQKTYSAILHNLCHQILHNLCHQIIRKGRNNAPISEVSFVAIRLNVIVCLVFHGLIAIRSRLHKLHLNILGEN